MAGLLTLPRFADKRILTPTVTGGCAADPTCDQYNIFTGGPAAQVVRGACDDLLHGLNADNQSFEGGTIGTWWNGGNVSLSNSAAAAWHGSRSLKATFTGVAHGYVQNYVTAITAAGGTYSFSGWAKAKAGTDIRIGRYDDGFGAHAWGTYLTATGSWQFFSISFPFHAASTVRIIEFVSWTGTHAIGDEMLIDGCQLTQTASPMWFALEHATAMTQTVPTASLPIYAGGGFGIMCAGFFPWVGNDSQAHMLASAMADANNGWYVQKSSGNNLELRVYNAGSAKYKYGAVNGTNWPVGFHAIFAGADTLNNQVLYLDRTELTSSSGSSAREPSINANLALGYYQVSPGQYIQAPAHFTLFNRLPTPAEWSAICDELGVA